MQSARNFLANADWTVEPGKTIIRFHDRYCHMEPWVVAALAAWGLRAQEAGVEIAVENANRARYAWRMGLDQYLGVDPGIEVGEREETGRFLALRSVKSTEEVGAVIADVVPLLHLEDQPEQRGAVQYALSEMIRNVREHSGSDHGAVVCAQWYRRDKPDPYVSVGIADTGRGIRRSLLDNYPDIADDAEALLTALLPGVTGSQPDVYGSSNNAGAGLFYTRQLAAASVQRFGLISGEAVFRSSTALRPPEDSDMVFPISAYPGTVVSVNIAFHPEASFETFIRLTGSEFTRFIKLDEALRDRVETSVVFK